MKNAVFLAITILILLSQSLFAQKLSNPVVPIYDGCVERFMGYYYAMGTGTMGQIYSSKDLINWSDPVLAAKTDEATWLNDPQWNQRSVYTRVGAGDILYRNGVFHIYFNGIGHSYADNPLGMYKEQAIDEPFDDYGIDVQVFQDEDGELYYVKKVNPDDPHPITGANYPKSGAEVWAFEMNSPFVRKGIDGSVQMTHQIGHPTNVDFINFEGPELFKYRDNYYMMYSPNRMSARTGMYEVGVAQSDKPNNFDNSKKYPHPVLTRNTEDHLVIYKQILNSGEHGPWQAQYITTDPIGNWKEYDYDDSSWKSGNGGFGLKSTDLAPIRSNRTTWNTDKLFIRRTFDLDYIPQNAALKYRIEADTKFYINGNELKLNDSSTAYSLIDIDPAWLKLGGNIIAVEALNECSGSDCFKFVDFGLFDTGEQKAEKIVIGQSQSNYVVGPGGFERWIMYKAFFNGVSSQGIDRMHFYDKELVVESSASVNSPGYHPVPATPTFISYFDYNLYNSLEFLNNSSWSIKNKELYPKEDKISSLLLRTDSMTNYRFEVPFKIQAGSNDYASVYAWYQNEDNFVRVTIYRDSYLWECEIRKAGNSEVQQYNLPDHFEFLETNDLVSHYEEPWHTMTIYKNGGNFKIELDYFNLTLNTPVKTDFEGSGRIGIEASSSKVAFDAIQYTIGFDEWDNHITGWESSESWDISQAGMTNTLSTGVSECFKGDYLTDYEFSTFVRNENIPNSGKCGFYPLYIDPENYVKAYIDYQDRTLHIDRKEQGEFTEQKIYPLDRTTSRQYTFETYPTNSYRYDFRTETEVSGLDILWFEGYYPYLKQTFDLPLDVDFYALQGSTWTPIDATLDGELRFAELNHYTFNPIKTTAIKLEVTTQSGKAARAFSAYFDETLVAGYYLRARRENDQLYLYLNDKLIAQMSGYWAPSRIGLFTEGMKATYNGNLYYQTGQVPVEEIEITSTACPVGETIELTANVFPENATNKILVWSSSNPAIASIEGNKLTRHKEGVVKISAWPADGSIKYASINLGESSDLEESTCPYIDIYPNPATDEVHIRSGETLKRIDLLSANGICIQSITPHDECIDYNLSIGNLSPNLYFIKITTSNNSITHKIIKQ